MSITKKNFLTLTKSCNLRCVYCHQGQDKPELQCTESVISPDVVKNYFPKVGDYSVIFYGGEPFMCYDYMIRLAIAMKEHNPDMKLSTITNGTMLTVNRAKELNSLEMSVAISHDGRFFEQTRGVKDYLITNPEPFLTLNKRNISATACRINYDFYDIWNYFEEFRIQHGLKNPEHIHIQVVKDVEDATMEQLLIKDMPEFEAMLDKVFKNIEEQIRRNNLATYEFQQYLPMIKTLNWRLKNTKVFGVWCGADTQVSHMDISGNLYPCHNSTEPNGHVTLHGNRAGNYNPNINNKECVACPAYIICGGGCPVASSNKRQYMCYTMYHQITRLLKILANINGGVLIG